MMALCEINQTQPCPFSLWPADKGLIWGPGGWGGLWAGGLKGILIKVHPTPLANRVAVCRKYLFPQ